MRSLLLRIFVSFWSIILITIVAAVLIGQAWAERTRIALQNFEVGDAVLEASDSLQADGRDGLEDWLRSLPGAAEHLFYIVDDRGRDLLGRRLPEAIRISMRRFGDRGSRPPRMRHDRPNLRPARPFTQLIGPDGRVYTVFVLPPQSVRMRWFLEQGRVGLVLLTLIVSAAVSYLLARTISRPVQQLRDSANAIAGGRLDTRVADGVGDRRDELGLLAADFDRMADELQRAWEKQTELTRNVSHELRSPLARLRVALELARRKTGERVELDRIDTETERLDELIGRLLEYSRLDADSGEARARVEFAELIHSVVEDVRYEFADEEVQVTLEAGAESFVRAYPGALRSCVENVIRNAMQHGGGEVLVRLSDEVGQAVLVVEDRGGGVADGELGRIFEPFYRSTTTQADQSRRSGGLGLAIASRAIAMHDGSIRASNTGDGLRIEIRLPLAV